MESKDCTDGWDGSDRSRICTPGRKSSSLGVCGRVTLCELPCLNCRRSSSIDDHQTAREAFEKAEGRTFPDHKIPSENYFKKKSGEIETVFMAEKLSMMTSVAQ